MKGLYDVARHLVWLTQFGLSVVVPPTLCRFGLAAASVYIGRLGRSCRRCGRGAGRGKLPALLAAGAGPAGPPRQKRRRKNISYIL